MIGTPILPASPNNAANSATAITNAISTSIIIIIITMAPATSRPKKLKSFLTLNLLS